MEVVEVIYNPADLLFHSFFLSSSNLEHHFIVWFCDLLFFFLFTFVYRVPYRIASPVWFIKQPHDNAIYIPPYKNYLYSFSLSCLYLRVVGHLTWLCMDWICLFREKLISQQAYLTLLYVCKHITTSSCIDFNSGMANHHSSYCELNQSQLQIELLLFILPRFP